ncbi:MAG: acyl-CoA dehydrogenase, partial [Hyphomicrobiaceae bacterium]
IEGAPAGVKGISLFIVPRKRLDADGRPAVWNNVALAGLNHKMGQRGTVNTVLNVGEGGETIGEIVGAPGQGLAQMFTMMNEARIGVAMGAVAHASAGYRMSLAYARERLQGRHPDAKDPSSPQVPLIEHADVRRMLLQQKAAAEGGIAFALYLARLADLKKAAGDDAERRDAALLLDFLTPIFKAWMSEECLAANYNAIQILGGAGYTRDFPVEQHYRDNRLNPIHEGTNGIQAIDLLGRKSVMAEGRALTLFLDRIELTVAASQPLAGLAAAAGQLATAARRMRQAVAEVERIGRARGRAEAGSFAHDYMELAGSTAFAWIWLEQARTAAALRAELSASGDDAARLDGLMLTCRHVMSRAVDRGEAACRRILDHETTHLEVTDSMLG